VQFERRTEASAQARLLRPDTDEAGQCRWREGVDRQVYRGNAGHRAWGNIVNGTESTIRDCRPVNLSEEPDAGNPQVRFCEGCAVRRTKSGDLR